MGRRFRAAGGRRRAVEHDRHPRPDMANRLKYAGVARRGSARCRPTSRPGSTVRRSVPAGEQAYILPTYTAMLRICGDPGGRGAVETFWEQ